jgi:hypothetical protein
MDWMVLNQDRNGWHGVVKVVINLLVPNSTGNSVTSCEILSFRRKILLHGVCLFVCYISKKEVRNCQLNLMQP